MQFLISKVLASSKAEVSYVFHRNDVDTLQTITVDIKRIHSVDIVSIGIEIYIIYFRDKIFAWIFFFLNFNFGMRHLPYLPQCSYGHVFKNILTDKYLKKKNT
jgi:hypothetical protein